MVCRLLMKPRGSSDSSAAPMARAPLGEGLPRDDKAHLWCESMLVCDHSLVASLQLEQTAEVPA